VLSKKINEIKTEIEKLFHISDIEWDASAAAFHIQDAPGVLDDFEEIRKKLKEMGYLAALRVEDTRSSLKEQIEQLSVTPQLREISQRIRDSQEPEVRRAWIERFFDLSSCPNCESSLNLIGTDVSCLKCGWVGSTQSERGYVIVVTHLPRITPRSVRVNITLLIITILTTTITGSTLWMGYKGEPFDESLFVTLKTAIFTPEFIAMGALYFSLPLMIILGTHELGHYFMSKHYGVNASLPFFIPLPPGVSILGTMGAFISMREPMPNKKALFDIGIAGPIAGLIMAIPVTIIGFMLTEPVEHIYTPGHGPNVAIGFPLLFSFLYIFFTPDGGLHPTAFAGWVGLFVTALNLLPAGQLDGGHVARALLGEKSKYLSYTTLGLMILVGTFLYPAWLILGFLILIIGAYHPPPLNDLTDLDVKRKAIGIFSVVLLVLCFTPQPIVPLQYDLHVFSADTDAVIEQGGMVNFTIYVENTGEINNTYDITNVSIPEFWSVTLSRNNITLEAKEDNPEASKAPIFVHVKAPLNATLLNEFEVKIRITSQNESTGTFSSHTPKETITFYLIVQNPYDLTIQPLTENFTMGANETETTSIMVNNTGTFPLEVHLDHVIKGENNTLWTVNLNLTEIDLYPEQSRSIDVAISTHDVPNDSMITIAIIAMTTTPLGEKLEYGILHVTVG